MEENEFERATSGEVVKFENEGDSVSGIFVAIEQSIVYENSWAIKYVDSADKSNKVVFCTKILHDLIITNQVKPGDEIIIKYLGKEKTKDGKKAYNNYELLFKRKE